MTIQNKIHKWIIGVAMAFACAALIFTGSAQTVFAAGSIPVQVKVYENGDLDGAEAVWEGTFSPSGGSPVSIEKAADAFASRAPEGYTFGIAAVENDDYDTPVNRVAAIDFETDRYILTSSASYSIQEEDMLALYFYPASVEVPVYWCRYDIDGTLLELSDNEYAAYTGNETRIGSITVAEDDSASLAPIEAADIITAETEKVSAGPEAFVVAPDGLVGTVPADAVNEKAKATEEDETDSDSDEPDSTLSEAEAAEWAAKDAASRTGSSGKRASVLEPVYKFDSQCLLLENTPLGIAFTGSTIAGMDNRAQKQKNAADDEDVATGVVTDTTDLEASLSDYATIPDAAPAVYVIYPDKSDSVPLALGAPDSDENGLVPWLLIAAVLTLILIIVIATRVGKKKA